MYKLQIKSFIITIIIYRLINKKINIKQAYLTIKLQSIKIMEKITKARF